MVKNIKNNIILQLSLTSVVVKVTVSRLVKIQTISSQLTTTGTGIVYQAINQFIYSGGCWTTCLLKNMQMHRS